MADWVCHNTHFLTSFLFFFSSSFHSSNTSLKLYNYLHYISGSTITSDGLTPDALSVMLYASSKIHTNMF